MCGVIVADFGRICHDGCQWESSQRPSRFQGTSDHRIFQLKIPVGERARQLLRRLIRRDPPSPQGRRKGYCFAKVRQLAEELGVSERTIQYALKELKRWNLNRRDPSNPWQIFINYQALRQLSPPVTILCTPRYDSCPGCGRAITERKSAKRRYHSAACRMRAYRRRRRRKTASVLIKCQALRQVV